MLRSKKHIEQFYYRTFYTLLFYLHMSVFFFIVNRYLHFSLSNHLIFDLKICFHLPQKSASKDRLECPAYVGKLWILGRFRYEYHLCLLSFRGKCPIGEEYIPAAITCREKEGPSVPLMVFRPVQALYCSLNLSIASFSSSSLMGSKVLVSEQKYRMTFCIKYRIHYLVFIISYLFSRRRLSLDIIFFSLLLVYLLLAALHLFLRSVNSLFHQYGTMVQRKGLSIYLAHSLFYSRSGMIGYTCIGYMWPDRSLVSSTSHRRIFLAIFVVNSVTSINDSLSSRTKFTSVPVLCTTKSSVSLR